MLPVGKTRARRRKKARERAKRRAHARVTHVTIELSGRPVEDRDSKDPSTTALHVNINILIKFKIATRTANRTAGNEPAGLLG